MANFNRVFLMGNLTRDPEMRYTPSGTAVVNFGMAVNRHFTDQNGEKKEETCFVRISVFGKQGENCNQYLSKGSPVFIEGRLQYRTWETDGQKRNSLDVVAERVQFMGRAKEGQDSKTEDEVTEESPSSEHSSGKVDINSKATQDEDAPPF
ncbi:MAG: single-stranded DNA-binding protein [Candidatus Omnitrophica bacterium]|nr:single-stranded DNA-binding protein [Candidatus Omnitrophota bacterium]